MRRIRRGAVAILLVIGAVAAALSATAQALNPRQRSQAGQVTILEVEPDSLSTNNLNAREGELRLPIDGVSNAPSASKLPVKSSNRDARKGESGQSINSDSEASTAPQLPLKWGHTTESWETQVKKLEAVHGTQARSADSRTQPTDSKDISSAATLVDPAGKLPTPVETMRPHQTAAQSKPSRGKTAPHPNFAETRAGQALEMTWHRPGKSEESEPKVIATSKDTQASRGALTPLRSARRWPPAYAAQPSAGNSRAGVIDFADDPPRQTVAAGALASARHWPPAYVTGPAVDNSRFGVVRLDDQPTRQSVVAAPLYSSRRWSPAYVTESPTGNDRSGDIRFDDDPPQQSAPAATSPLLKSADLP